MPWWGWLIVAWVVGCLFVWSLCVAAARGDRKTAEAMNRESMEEK